MKTKLFLSLLLTCSIPFLANAHSKRCSMEGSGATAQKGTILSPLEDDYDVKYLKLDLAMSNANTSVSGSATIKSLVTNPNGIKEYAFELNQNITIDTVYVNGVGATVTNPTSYLRIISLADTIKFNQYATVEVHYHGTVANATGFFNGAFTQTTLSSGTRVLYTMSDDYFAKDWWPSKQSLLDKIDSADLWFTVPTGTMAGSNGILQNITAMGSANRYEWKTKYPIDYYLISAAIAPYVMHEQTVRFSGSTDTMKVQHFMYDTLSTNDLYKAKLDSVVGMIDHFSTLFGRYPFWKEKYGHCMAPLSGGMEHQTMTTIGNFNTTTIAHELGHQWWGDAVTYSSWRDIWLSEGLASYCEQLYIEKFRSVAAAKTYRTAVFNRVMSRTNGSVYVYDTSNVFRTFDSRLTYDKGAAVTHMLSKQAPNDQAFFTGLKNFQQQYAYSTAHTEQFKTVMETAYGKDLDSFFNQWIYGEGYPTYSIRWNQVGTLVVLEVTQTSSSPTVVSFFSNPIDIKLLSLTGDTTIKFVPTQNVQFLYLNWGQAIDVMRIDLDDDIVNKEGPISREAYLSVDPQLKKNVTVYPNPTSNAWQVEGATDGASAKLYNMLGVLVWEQHNVSAKFTIPAESLSTGNYELVILGKKNEVMRRKLVKL